MTEARAQRLFFGLWPDARTRRALARIDAPLPDGAADMPGVIVPRKTVLELAKLIEDVAKDIPEVDEIQTTAQLPMDQTRADVGADRALQDDRQRRRGEQHDLFHCYSPLLRPV